MNENKKTSHIVMNLTFEATEQIQQKLRRHIEKLIKENRPLKDEEERTLFYKELSHSTLGLGTKIPAKIFIEHLYEIGTAEFFARWVAKQTEKDIIIKKDGFPDSPSFEIKIAWEKLLDLLFAVFPHALDKSISMSRELDSSSGRKDSFHVGREK